MEIIEPHWDNNKSYLHLRKEKKVTFEDNMPNMKTDINHNVLTQTSENSNQMEYYEQTVKLIARVIEDLRNNTTQKGAIFAQKDFLRKLFKGFLRIGIDALTKEMEQLYRFFWPIWFKSFTTQ